MLGVSHVVTTSVGMCDIDIRPVSVSLALFEGTDIFVLIRDFEIRTATVKKFPSTS